MSDQQRIIACVTVLFLFFVFLFCSIRYMYCGQHWLSIEFNKAIFNIELSHYVIVFPSNGSVLDFQAVLRTRFSLFSSAFRSRFVAIRSCFTITIFMDRLGSNYLKLHNLSQMIRMQTNPTRLPLITSLSFKSHGFNPKWILKCQSLNRQIDMTYTRTHIHQCELDFSEKKTTTEKSQKLWNVN